MNSQHRNWVTKALEDNEQRLTAYVARILGGKFDLAADVVQHAFLKLCHQDREALGDNVAAWLYRVCRNRAYDEMRKIKMSIERNGFASQKTEIEETQYRDLERGELMAGVQELLERLPDEQREAIDMWSHGLRFREIGEALGKSEGAVRVSVHRAIKQLRTSQLVRSHLASEFAGELNIGTSPDPSVSDMGART